MLTDELKKTIQTHYSQLLENKQLKARHGQKLMIAEIANALASVECDSEGSRSASEPVVSVVEAGTGTGKTIAYLVPAIAVAQALGKKLVIATATVALQEQVMYKDLPDLQRHSEMKFSFALAKGRGRYLCLSKLDNLLRSNASQDALADLFGQALEEASEPDRALYQRMLDALGEQSWEGDRDDWPQALEEGQWRNVAVEQGQCSGNRCSYFSNCCFFRSRGDLEKADCIVANHDLVLADLSLGGGVILPAPQDTIYIFDEAHHLPLKGISHFSHSLRLRGTARWLEQVEGMLPKLQNKLAPGASLHATVEEAVKLAADTRAAMREAFLLLDQFEARAESASSRGDVRQYLFKGGVVDEPLREVCRGLRVQFAELQARVDKVQEVIKQCLESEGGELDRQQAETWFPAMGTVCTRVAAAERLFFHFAAGDRAGHPPLARWMNFTELNGELEATLSCSPVIAAEALSGTLWQDAFAVLLTSATLCALGNFDFLRMRAGLPAGTRYTRIDSPFDYNKSVLLKIPRSGFDPADSAAHSRAIGEILPEILEDKGGSLVLFSSRKQMQDVLYALPPALKERVLSQDDHSKQQLIALHKEKVDQGQGSTVFGLASLTEGIDLPGDYCTHVVIAKIPFAVPNDPVEATLSQWVQDQGKNPFNEISVPEASMRLIQACGRLVRTEQDHGTLTILDQRLVTRRYGQAILDSLPPYRREVFSQARQPA